MLLDATLIRFNFWGLSPAKDYHVLMAGGRRHTGSVVVHNNTTERAHFRAPRATQETNQKLHWIIIAKEELILQRINKERGIVEWELLQERQVHDLGK